MARSRRSPASTIEEVLARFEQWRQTRQGKTRIPEELWSAAVTAARRDGVSRTAAALHLDGSKLKRRMVASDSVPRKAPSGFVELIASSRSDLPEYILELEGRGGTLRIHCKGTTAAEVAALSRAVRDEG